MAHVTYRIVEHNGGFAYKVDDVFSETFATHEAALEAARDAAERQQAGVRAHTIEYQDKDGQWHNEVAREGEGIATDVEDETAATRTPRDAEGHAFDEEDFPNLDRAPVDTAGKTFRH